MSLFTRGLRRLRLCVQRLIVPPPLWASGNLMGDKFATGPMLTLRRGLV